MVGNDLMQYVVGDRMVGQKEVYCTMEFRMVRKNGVSCKVKVWMVGKDQ